MNLRWDREVEERGGEFITNTGDFVNIFNEIHKNYRCVSKTAQDPLYPDLSRIGLAASGACATPPRACRLLRDHIGCAPILPAHPWGWS